MKEKIKRLYDEANRAHTAAKAILDEYASTDMSEEKRVQVDAFLDEVDQKSAEAKRLERAIEQERELNAPQNALGNGGLPDGKQTREPAMEEKAFQRYLRSGSRGLTEQERKALRADDDEAGGYLVAPVTFSQALLKFVDDEVFIRQLATVEQLTQSESLGIISLDEDFEDADWTSELATGNESTVKPFGKRALKPHPLAKRIKISNTLLRKSMRPVETLVQQRIGYKFGVTLEKGYLLGDGAQKPLGLFVPSTQGISTSRDVAYTVTSDKTKADSLIDAKYKLKSQYQSSPTTRWIFHRDFVKGLRKLRDANEQFLWQPGLQAGQPDRILDVPFVMSEFAPNTFSATNYVGLIGDIRFYWIVDSLQLQIQTLNELYAETNQRGYIARYEGDGAPMLEEAFVRLQHS
ncbi:MAG: phage major capsid protein [Chloroflexi bacterium]|nr:phage major capsid protein [Chloroflexota bacterium]